MTTKNNEQPLFYLAGATEGTTQWKAEKLQLINWGGFHGHTTVSFSSTATLLSGASGTGKSTLLDAYIALLMESNIPFNGASNDATVGRARGSEQRSLLSYLRGKLDTNRNSDTGELADQVLRGEDSATWGALAITFIDDNRRRYSLVRLYYVPRSANKDSDIIRKMCTIDGAINLRGFESFAAGKFDKRSVESQFPHLKYHDSYGAFSQAFFTRLGIGANGDGAKALRLLARIQAGYQVRTVDELYKSMVIEPPGTYIAADAAVEHFKNLEDAYEAMATEEKKAGILGRISEIHTERERDLQNAQFINALGIDRTAGTPFEQWKLNAECALILDTEEENNKELEQAKTKKSLAEELQRELESRKTDIDQQLNQKESHILLKRIDADTARLSQEFEDSKAQRNLFDETTTRLNLTINSEADFKKAQQESQAFIATFQQSLDEIIAQQQLLQQSIYEPADEKATLVKERESLSTRDGRMDSGLHASRLIIAKATGIDAAALPFVGELIDVLPAEKKWRKAIEITLFSVARVLLIDINELDRVSRIIDPLTLPHRINYQGVDLSSYQQQELDPRFISGKLAYKDAPFTAWVRKRITANSIDALCVNSPQELRGRERRVTVNGQTRKGESGAHGELKSPYVIGFSKEERLAEIQDRLDELEILLCDLDKKQRDEKDRFDALIATRSAHDHVLAIPWRNIDCDGIQKEINALLEQKKRLLRSDDELYELQKEFNDLDSKLKDVFGKIYATKNELEILIGARNDLLKRKDHVLEEIQRNECERGIIPTEEQVSFLDKEFAAVATVGDLSGFKAGANRLKDVLLKRIKESRDKADRAAKELETIFQRYLDNWQDPNLSASVENYPSFQRIFDKIQATGLHERRQDWTKRLTDWSGQDLVPLAGAFSIAIEDIHNRLQPINAILATLPFGDNRDHLKINLRELHREDIVKFKRELNLLSRANTDDFTAIQIQNWFTRLRRFMGIIRIDSAHKSNRDYFLDVRKHIEITAVSFDKNGCERSTFRALGGKSGGENQELVAFIVGAALRFQLGDDANARPRFAPVLLDEAFVKADSQFAGRAINAWKGLGFQLVIGTPLGQFTALEPHADYILNVRKNGDRYSSVDPVIPTQDQTAATNNIEITQ